MLWSYATLGISQTQNIVGAYKYNGFILQWYEYPKSGFFYISNLWHVSKAYDSHDTFRIQVRNEFGVL